MRIVRSATNVVLWMSTALAFHSSLGQQAHSGSTAVNHSALSPAFRTQIWRALDAFNRIDKTVSNHDTTSETASLILEAKKACDEAKYVAKTKQDNAVLQFLQFAVLSVEAQENYSILSTEWKTVHHRTTQCGLEATYYIIPKNLTPIAVELAKKGTCIKESEVWTPGDTP